MCEADVNSHIKDDDEKAKAEDSLATGNEDWLNDPRIAFNQTSQKWIFEDTENGLEYEYNEVQGNWVPVVDDAAIKLQQQAYVKEGDLEDGGKYTVEGKRKIDGESDTEQENDDDLRELVETTGKAGDKPKRPAKKKVKTERKSNPEQKRVNRGIYVSKLPLDTTVQELDESFSKYGLIAEDSHAKAGVPNNSTSGGHANAKRIKLYVDADGKLKGDALIVYFKPESVDLAVQMMDNAELRIGHQDSIIKVEPASYTHKEEKNGDKSEHPQQSAAPPAATEAQAKAKKKLIKQYQKMNNKLADWDDDDNTTTSAKDGASSKRWEKVVILKHVFTLDELGADVTAASDIKDDIMAGCEAIGTVTNVILYDAEPDGVVSVKFQHREDAIECVNKMNGRFFGGQRLEARVYDGLERYKRSKKHTPTSATAGAETGGATLDDEDNTGKEEEQRLEEFGNWLESQT